MSEQSSVSIPGELYGKLAQYAGQFGFDSTEELVLFILQDYLDRNIVKEDMELTNDEEKRLRKRLEDLGYL